MSIVGCVSRIFVRTLIRRKQVQLAARVEVLAFNRIIMAATGSNQSTGISSSASEKIDPRKFTEDEWLKKLSPEQYYVCREKGTEEPFTGKYYKHNEEGVYSCICCGSELFSSKTKYESGTGWPSFNDCVGSTNGDNETHTNIIQRPDNSLGHVRTEVICKKCDSHLGHVFDDGPAPSGHRYCINSAALKFVPKKLA